MAGRVRQPPVVGEVLGAAAERILTLDEAEFELLDFFSGFVASRIMAAAAIAEGNNAGEGVSGPQIDIATAERYYELGEAQF